MNWKKRLLAFGEIRKWKNPKIASALIGALALALGLGIYAFRVAIFPARPAPEPSAEEAATVLPFRHPLTGTPLAEAVEPPQVYAVMIDHSSDAWPQSGLEKAFLVFESPVEGGIPRLMALFTDEQASSQIGPVRSARPYFVDWAKEFDALYVHVGGSDAALDLIETNGTFDLNQFWHADAFWRSSKRFAPHNVYTSTQRLVAAYQGMVEAGRAPERLYGRWTFKDPGPTAETGIDATVEFLGKTYEVGWLYDKEKNRYERRQSGLTYAMEDGARIYSDNVAVVVTNMKVIDQIGRREIRTTGEGKAYVFRDGRALTGIWKKPSASERLAFFTTDGKPIEMNPGVTWIEVVGSQDQAVFEGK